MDLNSFPQVTGKQNMNEKLLISLRHLFALLSGTSVNCCWVIIGKTASLCSILLSEQWPFQPEAQASSVWVSRANSACAHEAARHQLLPHRTANYMHIVLACMNRGGRAAGGGEGRVSGGGELWQGPARNNSLGSPGHTRCQDLGPHEFQTARNARLCCALIHRTVKEL